MLQDEMTCGRKNVNEQKWRQMYLIPFLHNKARVVNTALRQVHVTKERRDIHTGRPSPGGEREEDKE